MMALENVGAVVSDLKTRVSGIAAALVSRDGQLLYANLPEGVYAETFAVMCATILAAAVTASVELGRGLPEQVVVEGPDARTVIVACGRSALLVAVVALKADLRDTVGQLTRFAELLRPA
jgi:uncharacterized protein